MKDNVHVITWLDQLRSAAAQGQLIAISFPKPSANDAALKSVEVRPILVKRQPKLSFTYHHQTRDIIKNYDVEEAVSQAKQLMTHPFAAAKLYTSTGDYHLTRKGNAFVESAHPPTRKLPETLAHDRVKQRLVGATQGAYLLALGLTDAGGNVLKSAQDKFRQINKYVEIMDGLIRQLPPELPLTIVDMGAGKGYLTFALYDHLRTNLGRNASVVGVEHRADLVAKCNNIAAQSGFEGLCFVEGSIADYRLQEASIVIALHACDTATDDAIYHAIGCNAPLIVVAPCCHKQLRKQMHAPAVEQPLQPLLKHGTYQDRLAEMVTDGIRAQLLEREGYRTKLFEFIGGEHTPKNVMIVAMRAPAPPTPKEVQRIQNGIDALKAQLGVQEHYLEARLRGDA